MDGHVGLGVSEDDAINCVPDCIFTFLNLVYGQDIWNQDGNPEDYSRPVILATSLPVQYLS
jgi:hypothetical protein